MKSAKRLIAAASMLALSAFSLSACSDSTSSTESGAPASDSASAEASATDSAEASEATFVKLDEALSSEHYAVGFKKGEEEFAAQVTETMQALDNEGEIEKLVEKYADQGMSYDNWVLPKKEDAKKDAGAGQDRTFTVGFDSAYPPYGYVADDGSYTGFDLELAQMVAEANGWEFKAEPIDWDAKDAQLNSGTIDVIWNGFTMEGREDQYTFSEPYMLNEQVVVVRADSGIDSLDGLKDKNVITQVDSAAYEVLGDEEGRKDLADTFANLATIGDYNNAFMQLESGQVDAVACDLSIAEFQLAKR